MGNLKQKYTDEEWEELEEFVNNSKAKKQALKDIKNERARDKKDGTPRRRRGRD